jgi:hypothetical protein
MHIAKSLVLEREYKDFNPIIFHTYHIKASLEQCGSRLQPCKENHGNNKVSNDLYASILRTT